MRLIRHDRWAHVCSTISVGWRGEVYDCDFNQQLGMQWKDGADFPVGH
jgi:hypothetical protein